MGGMLYCSPTQTKRFIYGDHFVTYYILTECYPQNNIVYKKKKKENTLYF